jgi:uncharacterized protein YecE (DUF72 family)
MASKRGLVRIGTSNVVIPGNKKTFPEAFQLKSRLHYYSSLFNTVEVNSCFYKTPLLSTYEKWSLDVPGDFQFSLKLSKEITHAKNLEGELSCMDNFLRSAGGIGKKKGCLLVQFPGKITLDYFTKVEAIMSELQIHDPSNEWRKAIEFRHASWYTGETFELLDEYGAAMVLHDIPKGKNIDEPGKTDFIYIRFHGPKGDYRDSYTDNFLRQKAAQINVWLYEGKDVYVYFNNTIGSAFDNAVSLKRMLEPANVFVRAEL